MTKLDFTAVYRRLHTSGISVSQAIVIVDDIALLAALRMTFGGTPSSSMWSDVSKSVCNTCNLLSQCKSWNPKSHPTLESPHRHKYVTTPHYQDSQAPCNITLPTIMEITTALAPFFMERYLHDLFTGFLDQTTPIWTGSRITLLMLHLIGRPISENKPLKCNDLLAFDNNKMIAEGSPEESKIILGWEEINTCTLWLHLPQDKLMTWNAEIDQTLQSNTVDCDALATTIRRLNHALNVSNPDSLRQHPSPPMS